jgi:hypothetical protein
VTTGAVIEQETRREGRALYTVIGGLMLVMLMAAQADRSLPERPISRR